MCPEYGATVAIFPIDEMTLEYLRFTGRDAAQVAAGRDLREGAGPVPHGRDAGGDLLGHVVARPRIGGAEPRRAAAAAGPRAARRAPRRRLPRRCRDLAEGHEEAGVRRRRRRGCGRGRDDAARSRVGRDRGHHELHEHVESERDDRRGPGREEGRREGADAQAVGEDEPGAGLEGRHRVSGQGGAVDVSSTPSGSTWSATAARPASATAVRCPTRSPRKCASDRWSSARCCPATATSRAASSRTCAPTTWRRRRWSSRTRMAGSLDVDLTTEPLGTVGTDGPVFLKDIWPTQQEIQTHDARRGLGRHVPPAVRRRVQRRRDVAGAAGADRRSVRLGSRLDLHSPASIPREPVEGARGAGRRSRARASLALLGDSITTDHISPAGSIKADSPAGQYLIAQGVTPRDFNSYGARRGNHEVMMRGTFANVRLENQLAPGHRRRGDDLPARRRGDVDLRRVDGLPGGRRAADHPGGQGIRIGIVARLGGQGHDAARREGRHRGELRAHPPQQPRQHGRAAPAVRRRASLRRRWA